MKEAKENKLKLIPKIERYMYYMITLMIKLPRTEKFSIGTEYKLSIYSMLENTLYIQKIENKEECLEKINKIDAELNAQRVFLRIMLKQQWIDYNKFNMAMSMIYEMGKMVGGLTKYYAENNKK